MSKILDPMAAAGRDLVVICGSFAPQGTNPPTVLAGKAEAVIARANVGQFTVTIDPPYPECVSTWASVQLAAPTNIVIEWVSGPTVGSVLAGSKWTGTLVATTAGAAADIAADPQNVISWGVIMRRTSFER